MLKFQKIAAHNKKK